MKANLPAKYKPIGQYKNEPCAIVLGSEDIGIYAALMKICDESFKIPMQGDFESLNVSVAGGMILYEAMKQRMTIA